MNEIYAYDWRDRVDKWAKVGAPYEFDRDRIDILILHGAEEQAYGGPAQPHAIQSRGTPVSPIASYDYDEGRNIKATVGDVSPQYCERDLESLLCCLRRKQQTSREAFLGRAGLRPNFGDALLYMQARWYDPGSGRFLSVDPLIRSLANPQSLNAYSYAENNPLKFTDPTGMSIWAGVEEFDGGTTGGGGGGAGMGAFSQSGTAMAASLGGLGSITVTPFSDIGVSPFIPASESESGSESEGDSTSEEGDGESDDAPMQIASLPPPKPIAPPSRRPTLKEIGRELELDIMIEATDALEDDWDPDVGDSYDAIFGPAVPPGYNSPK